MTTWTVTASGDASYVGPSGVDLIDIQNPAAGVLYIAASKVESFTISGRGTFFSMEVNGSSGPDYAVVTLDGATLVNFSTVSFTDWSSDDVFAITGSIANETVTGTARDDVFRPIRGSDSFNGGDGTDQISIYAYGTAAAWRSEGASLTNGVDTQVRFSNVEEFYLFLGSGDDSIVGLAGTDEIYGNAGNDVLSGGGSFDALYGGEGEDQVSGQGGNDFLYGGAEDDLVLGGAGSDQLSGDGGVDSLYGGTGDDRYLVTGSQDRIFEYDGGYGYDTIFAKGSFDMAKSGGFDVGEVEALKLEGGAVNGFGNAYANLITGTAGANVLRGRGGADLLVLKADAAKDTIVFRSAADSGSAGYDTVFDFDANGEDRLDVRVGTTIDIDVVLLRSGGSLSAATFDADIKARLDGSFDAGGGVQAILWDPAAGTLDAPGERWLVVDLDDNGSFQPGTDLVVRFANLSGTLDLSDCITF